MNGPWLQLIDRSDGVGDGLWWQCARFTSHHANTMALYYATQRLYINRFM